MALDISTDYLCWERLEPIVFYPAPRNDLAAIPIARAKRRAPTTREQMASGGAYTSQDLVWLVPRVEAPALVAEFPPKPGDVIEDADGMPWTVLSIEPYAALKTFWRLTTRNLVLAVGLRDEVSILRPTITVGESAEPVYAWPPQSGSYVVQELAARVQPMDGSIDVRNEVETAQGKYTVILGQQVDLRAGDRILVTAGAMKGKLLRWVSQRNQERIDELPALECERV